MAVTESSILVPFFAVVSGKAEILPNIVGRDGPDVPGPKEGREAVVGEGDLLLVPISTQPAPIRPGLKLSGIEPFIGKPVEAIGRTSSSPRRTREVRRTAPLLHDQIGPEIFRLFRGQSEIRRAGAPRVYLSSTDRQVGSRVPVRAAAALALWLLV